MRFIESIRFENGQFHLLELHQARMERTFKKYFADKPSYNLSEVLRAPFAPVKTKIRVEYDGDDLQIAHSSYHAKEIHSLKCVTTTMDYSFKYADRSAITGLLMDSGASEIIMIKDGLVTDSSYSNVACFDGKNWWTPKNPLLEGVRREELIRSGLLNTIDIRADELKHFQKVCLINAMLGLEELDITPLIG